MSANAPAKDRCRHFGICGGCAIQDMAPEACRALKRKVIADSLSQHGVGESVLRDVVSVPPRSRRRATLKVLKQAGETRIGFHALRSHDIVDMRECLVLRPALLEAAQALRRVMTGLLDEGEGADLYLLEADNGIDLDISWRKRLTPALVAQIAAVARSWNVIRVTAGGELICQSAGPEIFFGPVRVRPPPRAFLQPTREGEAMLQSLVLEAVGRARRVADLFSGCGTFALPLAARAKVHAFDAADDLLQALSAAVRAGSGIKPLAAERRDLFKRPLALAELSRFDAAVLDPPRAGALAQAKILAKSNLKRIAYVSCDAASFARDAKVLIDGGFRLASVMGIDQFLWSTQVELAAAFARE